MGHQCLCRLPGFLPDESGASLAGSDTAVDKVAARLIEKSSLTAPQIAAEVMKGIDARRMVIQPDAPGRKAVWTDEELKRIEGDARVAAQSLEREQVVGSRQQAVLPSRGEIVL